MGDLSLSLLGPFVAELDGAPIISFRTSKVQALLICIAVEPGPHNRELLMTRLWPGMPERSARHNLRQTLYHLRTIIPDFPGGSQAADEERIPIFLANRQAIELHPQSETNIDVREFERLIAGTIKHPHPELLVCPDCRADLEAAVALYRGDFLSDFYLDDSNEFEEWADGHRGRYRRQVLDALETLTTIALRRQEFVQARSYAEQQLNIDNLREGAYRRLMEALALAGRREEALVVYEKARRILAEDLGMAPSKRTTEKYEQILSGDLSIETPLVRSIRGYDLKEQIGEGAYATVHRAIQPGIDREVAVKVIRPKYANDAEFIRRFEAEAQLVAALEHPHIVPLYDYWREPEGAFLVMRYMRGGSLLSSLAGGPLAAEKVASILDQVSAALHMAHNKGVIHRDIKPDNILLDEEGNVFLSDFGIAKNLGREQGLTAAGAIIGTPDYISPEQILNEPLTRQTDIYSLGAVVYEALTGEKPFPDSSVANLLYKHLQEPLPPASATRPDLPLQVDQVILRATAKKAADRYPDCLVMAEDFRRALRGFMIDPALHIFEPLVEEVFNPYKGLRAFQEADADDFYGREGLVEQLISRVAESRFVAVVGPSGSGKSSAVKAGLIPALRSGVISSREGMARSDQWFITEMTPGFYPLDELELALWPIAVDPPPSLVEPMSHDARGLLRTIRRIMPDEEGAQLLLVIDQFEELFTLVESEERRTFFLDSLLQALAAPRSPLRVVITMRADFYDRPLQYESLGRLIKHNTEVILPLTSEELNWAIREPARRMGVALDEGLAESIVADVAEQPGALPLLQYALTELFELRDENGRGALMSREAYEAIGGVRGALGRRAEEIYESLDDDEQAMARQLFLRLVTLGEGVEDTRRRVLRSELEGMLIANSQHSMGNGKWGTGYREWEAENRERGTGNGEQGTVNSQRRMVNGAMGVVIDAFGAARLLTFDRDPLTREPTVEVAHEALLRVWRRLRRWLDESRSDVGMQRMLARFAAEWLESGRQPDFLLRGTRLDQMAGWAGSRTVALTRVETEFLEESMAERQARRLEEAERLQRELETAQRLAETERARAQVEEQRAEEQAAAARRLRRRALFLVGALIAVAVLAAAAVFFGQRSNQNAAMAAARAAEAQNEAQARATSEALAETARQTAETQAQIAFSRELAAAALNNLERDPERSVLLALAALDAAYTQEAEAALHQSIPMLRLVQAFAGHEDQVNDLAYSPDGTRLVTTSDDHTARVWDVATGQELLQLTGHDAKVGRVVYSPDGEAIATASADGTIKVWDARTGALQHSLDGHRDNSNLIYPDESNWVNALDYSPDGRLIATGAADGLVKLWDPAAGQEVRSLALFAEPLSVDQVAFSPDGSLLAVWGYAEFYEDNKLRVIDVQSGDVVLSLDAGEGESVANFAFSPDGTKLLIGDHPNLDEAVRMWDLETGSEIGRYAVGQNGDIEFSPDGSLFATNSLDGGARIWDAENGQEVLNVSGHPDRVWQVQFSPDGEQLATASADQTARIWDIGPGYEYLAVEPFADDPFSGVSAIAYNSEGTRLAAGGILGGLSIWDTHSGEKVMELAGHDEYIGGLAYSPDGRYLASSGDDTAVKMWDAASGDLLWTKTEHTGWVNNLAYSPDGTMLATIGSDDHVIVWDALRGDIVRQLPLPEEGWGIAFAPDSQLLATGDIDSSVILWNALTGEKIRTIEAAEGADEVLFDQDGSRLISGGYDGLLSIWDASSGELIREIQAHQGLVWGLALSPDGQTVATGSADQTVRLWDLASGEPLLSLAGAEDGIISVAFAPDGTKLAAAGLDGIVRVSVLELEELAALAKSRLSRTLSDAECRQYLHLEQCPES